LFLLSKGYTLLILIAFIISIPLAWYLSNGWLNRFTFRTSLTPFEFIIAGILTFLVAGITVGFKSIRAANTNPINTLREE
jgi:putative ABC transport system permease protein